MSKNSFFLAHQSLLRLLISCSVMVIGLMLFLIAKPVTASAASVDVRMTYRQPSYAENEQWQWLSMPGDLAGQGSAFTPDGKSINPGLNEIDPNYLPTPPQYNTPFLNSRHIVRSYVASANAPSIPDCATNVTARLTGANGDDARSLVIKYRDNDHQGTNGAFFNPNDMNSIDWGEVRAGIYVDGGGPQIGSLYFFEVRPTFVVPEIDAEFRTGNMNLTPAQARSGILLNYYAETVDFWSNAGAFGVGREFSYDSYGHPYVRFSYDTNNCQQFDLTPKRTINVKDSKVDFFVNNGGNGESRTSSGGVTLTRTIWVNGTQRYSTSQSNTIFGANSAWSDSIPLPALSPGDRVCAWIAVNPSAGQTGGSPTVGERSDGGNNVDCVVYTSESYFRVYGGDTVVGRQFKDSPTGICAAKESSSIIAYNKQVGAGWAGAGAQFAASASDLITNFMSASMHDNNSGSTPKPTHDLSFGNFTGTSRIASSNPAGNDGVGYGNCILNLANPDIYTTIATRANPGNKGAVTITGSFPGGRTFPNGAKNVFYYSGNLTITDNVTASNTWNSLSDISSVIVIVNGNINIAPNVRNLDGLYFATGTIDTCSAAGTFSVSACSANQLVVNGTFVAREVKLHRLKGDLKNVSVTSELPTSQNIAEVFNFSPELYLTLGNLQTGIINKQLPDAIVGLPPIL